MEKPKYLTTEFWAGIITAVSFLLVTLGAITQDEANTWVEMLICFVGSALPIIFLIVGYSSVRAARLNYGVVDSETPGYLTAEFWMMIATTIVMVLVEARVLTQEEAATWLSAVGPFAASLLTILAYVWGRLKVKEAETFVVARLMHGNGDPLVPND